MERTKNNLHFVQHSEKKICCQRHRLHVCLGTDPITGGGGGGRKIFGARIFFKPTRLQDFFSDAQALHELCKRIMYYSLPVGSSQMILKCVLAHEPQTF